MKYILFVLILLFAARLTAQSSQVNWSAFSSGFNVSNSANSVTISAAGQSFTGISSNGSSKVISGFLAYSSTIVTDVSDEQEIIPTVFKLNQNYPNPFNPSTIINYQIPEQSFVSLKIYDILGKKVATLLNEEKLAGSYNVVFNASSISSGVYFYTIEATPNGGQKGSFFQTRKMILLR